MSYIDAHYDRHNDRILISERVNGVRQTRSERCNHVFYYEHPAGSARSIYGDACRKFSTPDHKKFARELKSKRNAGLKIFESDIRPEFRFLEDHYKGADAPTLNVCFFDIETGFDPVRGYANPENPFNPITSITFWLGHLEKMVTVALVPPTLTMEEGQAIADKFENTFVFDDEADMLTAFLDLVEDVDLFSGWNCIPLDEPVWLKDRIKKLGDIKKDDMTDRFGRVLDTHRSGKKKVNIITLENGQVLRASDEHIIPYWDIEGNDKEATLGDIKKVSTDIYFEVAMGDNPNNDYPIADEALMSYREYLLGDDDVVPFFKTFDIETLSMLSKRQFGILLTTDDYGDYAQEIQILAHWNGFPVNRRDGHIVVLDRDDAGEEYLVRVTSIEETDEYVEMGDIHVQESYFTASGVTVHNSEGYDIPYLVNRVKMIMEEDELKKLCLFGMKPRLREYLRFGRKSITYDLIGKVHLDYLLLYQKHNPQQQHSYKLDFISEIEVGDNKTPYDGTLEDLYRNDFEKFIDYNRQDVMLLVKIDRKKKFIELSNQIAHANCVTLKTTMGSVALVEQAIICEMHDMGLVVPERKEVDDLADYGEIQLDEFGFEIDEEDFVFEDKEKPPVVGAYVSKPKTGIHHYIACMDINSLYPSVIRALNMSPETIVGQIRSDRTKALVEGRIAAKVKRADAWEGIFRTLEVDSILGKTDEMVTLDLDNGDSMEITGAQAYQIIYGPGSNLCMTANGTIFRTDVDGIIPQLLAKWYSDRKSMQAKEAFYGELRAGIPVTPEQEAILCG